MAAGSQAVASAQPGGADQVGKWFWNFLAKELTPYPGRAWVVGRVTISATIVMLLVMTFQLPSGALGAVFTLFLSRENPTATFQAGLRTAIAFIVATAYTAIGVVMFVDDPLTHFLWVAVSLFLSFYLIRIFADYGTAVAFGFMIAGAIPLWDEAALSVETRLENTLWLTFVVVIGVAVTIAVEYVFRRVHPTTDLTEGIEVRLETVGELLRRISGDTAVDPALEERIALYTTVGTSRLRRLILRSEYGAHFKAQMSTAIALVGRLIDIAGSLRLALAEQRAPVTMEDRERCGRLADEVAALRSDLVHRRLPSPVGMPLEEQASGLPFLPTMERTVALIPKAFSGSEAMDEFVPAPLDEVARTPMFVTDAFTNPAHLHFALRGTLAAMACYIIYTAIAWPGISTSVATCFITALSTIGSSRQKQILRLGGAMLGGFIFGMGAQIFVLPYLDGIAGFTVLFVAVTAISSWVSTASARLSYLGVQIGLAFYLINLQEFTIQTSLAVARDRVFGVLLGLFSMWLLFDRLWVRNAMDEMQTVFAGNLESFAELTEQLLEEDQVKAILRLRLLRDRINAGFQAVNAQADAVLFEFGQTRQRKLEIREDIRRWQPTIRTLLQLQVTLAQYRLQRPLKSLPSPIAAAHVNFERAVAEVMRAMANQVSGRPAEPVPEIGAAAARLKEEIGRYYENEGHPISTQASDVIGLAESMAATLAPLYEDIHATFAETRRAAAGGGAPLLQSEA